MCGQRREFRPLRSFGHCYDAVKQSCQRYCFVLLCWFCKYVIKVILYTLVLFGNSWHNLHITSSDTGRFSKFFHYHMLREICDKVIIKYPTTLLIASLHCLVKYLCHKTVIMGLKQSTYPPTQFCVLCYVCFLIVCWFMERYQVFLVVVL